MEITVKIPDEIAARAKARGLRVEAYIEEILAQQVGARPSGTSRPCILDLAARCFSGAGNSILSLTCLNDGFINCLGKAGNHLIDRALPKQRNRVVFPFRVRRVHNCFIPIKSLVGIRPRLG